MKLSVLSGLAILVVSSMAMADGVSRDETIAITKITQSGDFMPPTTRTTPESTITFNAVSTGCTDAKDFKAVVVHHRSGEYVTIVRTRPDTCRRLGHVVSLAITTSELAHSTRSWGGAGEVSIQNPIFSGNPIEVEDQTTH